MGLSAIFRIGKSGTHFDVQLSSVEAMHSAIEGKLVTLRWVRGSKSGAARTNVLATPDGRAMWPTADVIELTATLYRADAAGAFDDKEIKISLDEVVRAGATKTLATAKMDLAKFADKSGAITRSDCDLTLLDKDGRKGRMKLKIATALEGEIPRDTPEPEKVPGAQPEPARAHDRREKKDAAHLPDDRTGKARGQTAGADSRGRGKMSARERRALGVASDSEGESQERQDGKRPQGTRQEERRRKGSLKNEGEEQDESNEHVKEEEMKEDGKDEKLKDETRKEHAKDLTRKPLTPAPAHNVTRPQLVEPASDHASRVPSQKPARQRSPEGSPGARHGAARAAGSTAGSGPIAKPPPASKSPFLQPRTAQSDGSDSDPQLASVDDKPGTRKRVVRIGQTKRPHVNGNGPHTPQVHGMGRGVRERGMGSIQRILRQRVAASIASAAEAVRQEELQVSKMLLQVEKTERMADVCLLLEAAVFTFPLPPTPVAPLPVTSRPKRRDKHVGHSPDSCSGKGDGGGWTATDDGGGGGGSTVTVYLSLWLVTRCMRHWGLLDVVHGALEVPGNQEAHKGASKALQESGEDREWGGDNEPYFFYGKLGSAFETMARACDASGRVARCLISNLVILNGILQQQAAAASQADMRARSNQDDPGPRKSGGKKRGSGGAAAVPRAAGARAALLAQLQADVDQQALVLLRRLVLYECSQMEATGLQVAVLCSARGGLIGAEEQALQAGEEALEKLAANLAADGVVASVRRTVAQAVLSALDAALLDSVLRYGLVSCFDSALECKNVVAHIEVLAMYDAACMLRQCMTQHLHAQRCAHKLAAHFGFSPPHPAQGGAASTGPHPSQGELKLKLIRQAADLIMMEKSELVGPQGQQWRQQICPALSCRQIERLVINFTPCASAPEAVAPEVLRDLGRQALEEKGEMYAMPQLLQSLQVQVFRGLVPDVEDLEQAAVDLSATPPRNCIPPSLRSHPRFPFLLHAS